MLIGDIIQPWSYSHDGQWYNHNLTMQNLVYFLNHSVSRVTSLPYDSRLGFQLGKSTVAALMLCMHINLACTMYSPGSLWEFISVYPICPENYIPHCKKTSLKHSKEWLMQFQWAKIYMFHYMSYARVTASWYVAMYELHVDSACLIFVPLLLKLMYTTMPYAQY